MARPDGAGEPSAGVRAAAALREIGELLGLEPANRFRAQAYARGASIIAARPDVVALATSGRLPTLPGIGPAIARTVEELVRTGRSELLENLRRRYPPGAIELGRVLSLPRVRALHEALGVTTLAELRAACVAGRVRAVPGFGEKTERRLLARIDRLADRPAAVILPHAARQGDALLAHLRAHPAVARAELAGALRRRVETIARLDVVVATDDPAAVRAHLAAARGVAAVLDAGEDAWLLRAADGVDASVRVVPPRDFAPAWLDATGSAEHVAALARHAAAAGLTLEPRGLRRDARRLATPTEDAIYRRLGLSPIPPELREGAGEVEAAAAGRLPRRLVTLADLRGAVDCHTTYSDGRHTIEEMARAADALGLAYLTITDHSASATYARGLDVDRLRRQWDEIARVQEQVSVRLLRGTESDILRDGALDFPDRMLRELDVVIASIHARHGMDAETMTRRLVRALSHPVFKIWGHALGRYVLTRPPFACDMDAVLDAVAASRAAIEVNGDPNRLDLAPPWIREARRRGIRFVVSADAHSTAALHNLAWGGGHGATRLAHSRRRAEHAGRGRVRRGRAAVRVLRSPASGSSSSRAQSSPTSA